MSLVSVSHICWIIRAQTLAVRSQEHTVFCCTAYRRGGPWRRWDIQPSIQKILAPRNIGQAMQWPSTTHLQFAMSYEDWSNVICTVWLICVWECNDCMTCWCIALLHKLKSHIAMESIVQRTILNVVIFLVSPNFKIFRLMLPPTHNIGWPLTSPIIMFVCVICWKWKWVF